jgi:hypothetical protein
MKQYDDKDEEKLRALTGENKNSFSVPSGYFEKLSSEVADKINALPDFEKTSVTNPFTVPEGYFEKLHVSVSERISKPKSPFFTWLNGLQRPRIAIPIAFATIIILAGLYFYKQNNISRQPEKEFCAEDLSNSSYMQSIDETVFVDVLSEMQNDEQTDSLEQYLIDNNIDLSLIENNL